jgi:hypothetical protein
VQRLSSMSLMSFCPGRKKGRLFSLRSSMVVAKSESRSDGILASFEVPEVLPTDGAEVQRPRKFAEESCFTVTRPLEYNAQTVVNR